MEGQCYTMEAARAVLCYHFIFSPSSLIVLKLNNMFPRSLLFHILIIPCTNCGKEGLSVLILNKKGRVGGSLLESEAGGYNTKRTLKLIFKGQGLSQI